MSNSLNIDAIFDTAKRWANARPADTDRIMRAITIVTGGKVTQASAETFIVRGSEPYVVKVNFAAKVSTCTCPDARHGYHCKHKFAAALFHVCAGKNAAPAQDLFKV